MTGSRILPGLAALTLFTACRDTTPPTGPGESASALHRVAAPAADRARFERLARRMARALADPAFRARVKADLDRSPVTEHKLHFQRFLTAGSSPALAEVARLNGESDHAVRAEVLEAAALELYLPVPEHRARWTGGANVLVATAIHDGEAPVAYDVQGRLIRLSADAPPHTPVIALVPAETNFDATSPSRVREGAVVCPYGGSVSAQCGGGGGGGGTSPGLWMTYSSFTQTFEGWLKGSPEFEIHILGQAGATDSLTSYQCAGEHAGG
ncbi:MAG TPA: hypothetical protein VFM14_14605, partial [Gemmatimonadales bacterium]|nr:hypothetical protein [Gemmatimonadales bacterium]